MVLRAAAPLAASIPESTTVKSALTCFLLFPVDSTKGFSSSILPC